MIIEHKIKSPEGETSFGFEVVNVPCLSCGDTAWIDREPNEWRGHDACGVTIQWFYCHACGDYTAVHLHNGNVICKETRLDWVWGEPSVGREKMTPAVGEYWDVEKQDYKSDYDPGDIPF